MREINAIIIAVFVATMAFAGNISIISSFKAPSNNNSGISYFDNALYFGEGMRNTITKTTLTGSIMAQWIAPIIALDLKRDAGGFWVGAGGNGNGYIYRLTTTAAVLGSFKAPGDGYNIEIQNSYLWRSAKIGGFNGTAYIFQLDKRGAIMNSFRAPDKDRLGALAYNGHNLLYGESGWLINYFYEITTKGSIISSFKALTAFLDGLTYDGRHYWYINQEDDFVYEIIITAPAVFPASLGRVKAIYR